MEIRLLQPSQYETAQMLMLSVFDACVAPDYAPEGVAAFHEFIEQETAALELVGAFVNEVLVGVLATMNARGHITCFFVRGDHQRQGVGRALWQWLLAHSAQPCITVNASPGAVSAYARFGFVATGPEQVADGMRFTPMVAERSRNDAKTAGV